MKVELKKREKEMERYTKGKNRYRKRLSSGKKLRFFSRRELR